MEDETFDEAMERVIRALNKITDLIEDAGIKAQAAAFVMMLKSYREPSFSDDVLLYEDELLELPSMRYHRNVHAHNRSLN